MTDLPDVSNPAPNVPVSFEGEIYKAVGKHARSAVLFAFEQMGGAQGLAKWGKENEDEFYTKLFPKIIARESEVTHHKTVDQLMDVIDGEYVIDGDIEDAEEVVLHTNPHQVERVQPIAPNWNATDYDFENAEILGIAAATEDSVEAVDLVDFED